MGTRVFAIFSALAILSLAVYYGFFSKGPDMAGAWKAREALFGNLEGELRALADQIQAVQGQSQCDNDSECRIVGLGTRVCGRFKDFLIYSTKDAQTEKLLPLVTRFNEEHKKVSNLALSAANCGIEPAPIRCVEKHCVPLIADKRK